MFCFTVFCGHQGCSLTLTEISMPALALIIVYLQPREAMKMLMAFLHKTLMII